MSMDPSNQDARPESDSTEEQIVVEIERTRADMSGTIDQIGHRLNPQTIADQAREQIREATVGRVERLVDDAGYTAHQTGNTIIETIRQNPVPAALAAIGIGWLALRVRDSAANGGQRGRYAYQPRGRGDDSHPPLSPSYGYGWPEQHVAADAKHNARSSAADDVRRQAEQVGEQTRQAVDDVALRSQEAIEQAQYQMQASVTQAQRQFDRALEDSPLALGALAVGVGAAVGLAIPETRQERELMGEQRDKLVGQVEQAAAQVLGEAEKAAWDTGKQIRQEANQG